ERKNREYRLHLTFHGDLTKPELMKVNDSLEAKFPGRGSGEYHKMKYSTGGFSKGDKAAFFMFGIVGVLVKRFIQRLGRIFRRR
ncbi:MAG: hypothetical protein JSW28_04415, partial [Thermoplasmata archaeon]